MMLHTLTALLQSVMESRTQAPRPRPRPRTSLTRQRGTRLKSNSRAFTCNDYNVQKCSVIGNGQNSKLLPLKSFVQNMQWLVKSVSSSFSKDLSHEAKAKDSTRKAKDSTLKARPRPRTSKLSSRILEDEDSSSRTPILIAVLQVVSVNRA